MYVNHNGEVRFHCFGACGQEWDIYNLIQFRERCGFIEAQKRLADFLGIKDFTPYRRGPDDRPVLAESPAPDPPIEFTPPAELSPEVSDALNDAVAFYHCLLNQC